MIINVFTLDSQQLEIKYLPEYKYILLGVQISSQRYHRLVLDTENASIMRELRSQKFVWSNAGAELQRSPLQKHM